MRGTDSLSGKKRDENCWVCTKCATENVKGRGHLGDLRIDGGLFYVLLTVHLSMFLVINQLNAQILLY